ncbi:MAG: UPF0164 family protein [Treponema sp.]|jgi:hypothetical protein|nr:UPF0164 family protein [Treponema sp.]
MNRSGFLGLCGCALLAAALPALDFNEDDYGSLSDFLDEIYGVDENAGLTAFPVLNIPMGGRSEGMAGAFSAVADDASFLEWNPAGSSLLSVTELAFFHNNWISDTKVEGLVFASRYKNVGFAGGGKWLYTPFTEYNIYGERVAKGYYSEAVAVLNASYNFFSGYYFSGLSVGVNLKGAFRFTPDFTNDSEEVSAGSSAGSSAGASAGSGKEQSAAMAMADLGLLTRFDFLKFYYARERNVSAALVVRNLGPPALDDPLPTAAAAALSYRPLRPILLSFEFCLPVNLADPAASEAPYWAAGLSVTVARFLSMRAGLMAKTGNARIAVGSAVTLDRIALEVNYTLDLLTQFTPLNRISLGVRFNLGDQGRKALADEVERLYLRGLDAYSNDQDDEAQTYWEEAARLDPSFEPAFEGLALLRHIHEVENRINALNSLDF